MKRLKRKSGHGDRGSNVRRRRLLTFVGMGLFIAFQARAEVVMMPPPPKADPLIAGAEQFPESRFGQAPAKPDLGVQRGYARRAVESMESRDDAYGREFSAPEFGVVGAEGARSPAGMEFGGKSASGSIAASAGVQGPAMTESSAEPAKRRLEGAPLTPPDVNPTSMTSAIARRGVQEVALIAGDLGYFPKTVFVSRDVPVRLYVTGASRNTLCIMMDSFQVRRQVRSQKIEEITFTPGTPGKYRFYCPVNGMEGTLVVREFASSPASSQKE